MLLDLRITKLGVTLAGSHVHLQVARVFYSWPHKELVPPCLNVDCLNLYMMFDFILFMRFGFRLFEI